MTQWAVFIKPDDRVRYIRFPRKVRKAFERARVIAEQQDGLISYAPPVIITAHFVFATENDAKRAANLMRAAGVEAADEIIPVNTDEEEEA